MTNTAEALEEYLVNYLKDNHVIENKDEVSKRETVLSLLVNSTLPVFTKAVGFDNNLTKCLLLPFGSYYLGGYIRNADIDMVLICPFSVKRRNFIKFFPSALKQLPAIRNIEVIKKANVPIIKCVVDNISIDVSFVQLVQPNIDSNIDLLDNKYLQGIHPTCRASMDGPRVNRFIKKQIKENHLLIFQRSLQCIKHWAAVRQIYNKPIGYLNGSSWTLLLLKTYMDVCNSPQLSITRLLCSFFDQWRDWPWPAPVVLTSDIPGENNQRLEFRSLPDFTDAVMPIVTPCYPVSSGAPNVTKATLKVMTREFERAALILNPNNSKDAVPTVLKDAIRKLFNPVEYFKRYFDFITIITSTKLQSSCETWQRKMANAIPQLVQMIEQSPDLKCIQPIIKPTVLSQSYHTNEECEALQMGMSVDEAKQLTLTGQLNPGMVHLIYFFIGIQIESSCRTLDLSEHVESFERLLHSKRTKYDEDVRWHVEPFKREKVKEIVFYNA